MDETRAMSKEISLITLGITLLLIVGSALLAPAMSKQVSLGLAVGSLIGLLGFAMIVHMSNSIMTEGEQTDRAYHSQLHRYLLYGGVIAIWIYRGGNVIALIAGILAHKASILIYTWRHRKEDD